MEHRRTARRPAGLLPRALAAVAAAAALAWSALAPAPCSAGEVKVVQTRYYVLHTDLPPDAVQETNLRMTRMAEEYYERTKAFSGRVDRRLPFFLFQNREDYERAGGAPRTAGTFMVKGMDKKLMAVAGRQLTEDAWRTIQHEGFHQFADATIGDLPTWANEGLAEYFGEGVWTGDGFVFGVVTPDRLADVQRGIKAKAFHPLPRMLQITLKEWNAELKAENYDQAWAMSHFLAHAYDGRFARAFVDFTVGIHKRQPWQKAWMSAFGPVGDFEKLWAEWWLAQAPDGTAHLRTRATLSTLAGYAARAHAAKKLPPDLAGMVEAIKAGEMTFAGDAWLPPSLIARTADELAEDKSTFALVPGERNQPPKLLAERPDGTRMTASFPAKFSLPVRVGVEVDDLVPIAGRAEAMAKAGKKKEAKALLADALKRNPKSPAAGRAKKLMAELK